ncbi:MAG: DUF4115 domain-containing protein [Bryobacteraceae bacterium]|nr:DUF4115 domain-containing protein [Bryobacteraceae bacterium]
MYSIGQRLREERLRKGIKLSEISDFTRIRVGLLEAIEADQFDQLPGNFYARSFIRQYARYIGLEDPELEAEIKRQLGEPGPVVSPQEVLSGLSVSGPEKPPVLWRTQPTSRKLAYATAALLALAGFLGIYLSWRQVRARAQAEWEAGQTVQTAPSVTAGEEPAQSLPERTPAAAPTPAAEQRAPASLAEPAAPLQAGQTRALTVEVAADRDSWLEVRADGEVVHKDLLRAGQSRTFRASERIRIVTGNAGGLRIVRNGTPIGPIGPEGQVRTIELTPEGHAVVAPKPKPTPVESQPPEQPQESAGPPGR